MIQVRNYDRKDAADVLRLWNTAGADFGYAPLDAEGLDRLILRHPNFSDEHTFILEEDGVITGFINGVTGDDIAWGDVRGYFSCLLLDRAHDSEEKTFLLLRMMEDSFRQKEKKAAAVTCFNPIRLPWILPGTPGHQHNNMPGIPKDTVLDERMLRFGYQETAEEMAMYLDLSGFIYSESLTEKEKKMAANGYYADWYREGVHQGLDEMVESLNNPMWSAEVPAAGHSGMKLLVGLEGNTVAGFTGPVYKEPTGRGYFAGLAVGPSFRKHGLGELLFFKLCRAEKECGAEYMSLFTGVQNNAQMIYREAGYEEKRHFAVMIRELDK